MYRIFLRLFFSDYFLGFRFTAKSREAESLHLPPAPTHAAPLRERQQRGVSHKAQTYSDHYYRPMVLLEMISVNMFILLHSKPVHRQAFSPFRNVRPGPQHRMARWGKPRPCAGCQGLDPSPFD